MKILFITSRGDVGGGVVHLIGLIEFLLKRPLFSIFLAAPDANPLISFFEKCASLQNYFEIPSRRFRIWPAIRLGFFCHVNKIDVIHTHGLGAEFYGRVAAYISGAKLVHTPHGIHLDRYGFIKKWVVKNFERFGLAPLKMVVCVSHSELNLANYLRLWPGVPRSVIHNGVRLVNVTALKKSQARHALNMDCTQKIVLTVGRFDPVKNFNELLAIAERCADASFWIVGEGEEFLDIKAVSQKRGLSNIVFWGARSDVDNFYAAADIYLSTSIREGLPLTLIEASAFALPIICTGVPGNIDVVQDGVTGCCYSLGAIDEAVCLIKDAFRDISDFVKLGLKGQERQRELFSLERCMLQYEALYAEIDTSK